MAYVQKGLGLKRKSTEAKDSMKAVEKGIQELEEKKRKLLQYIVFFQTYVFFLGFLNFVFSPLWTLCFQQLTVLTHAQHAENCDKEIFIKVIFTSFIAIVFHK